MQISPWPKPQPESPRGASRPRTNRPAAIQPGEAPAAAGRRGSRAKATHPISKAASSNYATQTNRRVAQALRRAQPAAQIQPLPFRAINADLLHQPRSTSAHSRISVLGRPIQLAGRLKYQVSAPNFGRFPNPPLIMIERLLLASPPPY